MSTNGIENVRNEKRWDKRTVLVIEIALTLVSLLLFIIGLLIKNIVLEGIASNCFTAFVASIIISLVEWRTETDTEIALDAVEKETKARIDEMRVATSDISGRLSTNLVDLRSSMDKFSNLVELYSGKSCTFCKNSIKSVKMNRDDCNLGEFFNSAKESISILATNLESFTPFIPIFEKKAKRGVVVRIATLHPTFGASFNIARVVGRSSPEERWEEMKSSLEAFLIHKDLFQVRVYSKLLPTVILMIVDDQCYVSYLLHGHKSRETPHFLFTSGNGAAFSPVENFKSHFEGTWTDLGTNTIDRKELFELTFHSSLYHFVGWQNATSVYSNGITLCDLYDVLTKVWSVDTCTPRLRSSWSKSTPYIGQCTITAFLVQDLFGGEVFGTKLEDGHYHSFNVINEQVFDLTSEQFPDIRIIYSKDKEQSREDHLSVENKKERYEKLKQAVEEELAKR